MIDFFDNLYNSIGNNRLLANTPITSVLRYLTRIFANLFIPLFFILTQSNKKHVLSAKDSGRKIVVSLTSFPTRINRVWLVIETILRQTQKPDKLILWLSREQFHCFDVIPRSLLKLQKRGLEIRLCPGDLRSHKKYYYTLQECPNDIMITIDDDIFYRSKMISDLYEIFLNNPNSIVCQRAYLMKWDNLEMSRYHEWALIASNKNLNCDTHLFFCTGGGTLFPPKSLHEDTLKAELFLKLAPFADDIWLNAMCKLKKTSIIKTQYSTDILPIINIKNITLASKNIGQNLNDDQLDSIIRYYTNELGVNPFA